MVSVSLNKKKREEFLLSPNGRKQIEEKKEKPKPKEPSPTNTQTRAKNTHTYSHPPPPTSLSSNGRPAACVDEKWIGCLLVKVGTGANAVCIIRWHVSANVLCMRRPGAMQHSGGQGGRRWGRHSLEPEAPSPLRVCVCVWALSKLAGGATHLETQLGDHSRNRLSLSHTHC